MQKLEINKENALKAYNEGCSDVKKVLTNLFGKENFVPQKLIDRIKNFDDILKEAGISSFPRRADETDDEYAFRQAKLITKVYNEGWVPDYENGNQAKWYAWFYIGGGFRFGDTYYDYSYSSTGVGSRLCFSSQEKAKHAALTFTNIYKTLLT